MMEIEKNGPFLILIISEMTKFGSELDKISQLAAQSHPLC